MPDPGRVPDNMVHVVQPAHWRAGSALYVEPYRCHTSLTGPNHDDAVRRETTLIDARLTPWTFPEEKTTRLPLDQD